jgi:hypothetical protein
MEIDFILFESYAASASIAAFSAMFCFDHPWALDLVQNQVLLPGVLTVEKNGQAAAGNERASRHPM